METVITKSTNNIGLSKPFWLIWSVELWERFGFYGVQAILAVYFVKLLGYSETQSFYVFGSFSAFVYGFVWVGGWLGDKYFGAKRTLLLGAIILMASYAFLALANHHTVFYALAGIVVGNALFKANPSSLISKMFHKGDSRLDSAMTLYYMAVNVGSMLSMGLTPIIAQYFGWACAYWICSIGLMLGVGNYIIYRNLLSNLSTEAGRQPFQLNRLFKLLSASLLAVVIIAQLLSHPKICNWIVYAVVLVGFIYFIVNALQLESGARARMLVAFALILQGVLFFVLYNQMPTSLTFFAAHNVNNHLFGLTVPAEEYQVLNPIVVVFMSPVLAWIYHKRFATHVTKFCIGMSLCAIGFLILGLPQFISTTGIISPLWLVVTYFFQSVGELLISGLGLAMVAELCPKHMSGYVMGMWFLTLMLAGPIGAWVGSLTAPAANIHPTVLASMHTYSKVFVEIGLVTSVACLAMWLCRPLLNRLITE